MMMRRITWSQLNQTYENAHEQKTMLLKNIRKCLELVRIKEKSSSKIIESWLTIVVIYFENTKCAFIQRDMMNAMNKMTVQFNREHMKMKESNVTIRHDITEIIIFFKFFFIFMIKTSFRNWTIVVATFSALKIIANKNIEIIVRLNDNEKKQQLSQYETKRIVNEINICITKKDIQIKEIRAIKKLLSENLVIHAMNAEKTNKLRDNNAWTTILDRKTKAIVSIYAIMISEIEIKKFDLTTIEEKKITTRKIREKNENMKKLRKMKILYVFWRNKFTTIQQYHILIIEVIISKMNNSMLNNNIMIEEKLRTCSMFNKACKIIQCYKCHYHEHTTMQCTKEERCEYCAETHVTREKKCAADYKIKCCVCEKAHNSWRKECRKKQKKIERILYQRSITSARFEIQRQQYIVVNKTITISKSMNTTHENSKSSIASKKFSQLKKIERRNIEKSRKKKIDLDEINKRKKTNAHEFHVKMILSIDTTMISSQLSSSSQKFRSRRNDKSTSSIKNKRTSTIRKRQKKLEKRESFFFTIIRTSLANVTNRNTKINSIEKC